MTKKAMNDVTLHDGTHIPKGTLVGVLSYTMHRDDALYADGDTFDPFRFARMASGDGKSLKHQLTTTSPEYIAFGHGQHAWYVVRLTPVLLSPLLNMAH